MRLIQPRLIIALSIFVPFILISATSANSSPNRFLPNTSFNAIDLSGLTIAEANERIRSADSPLLSFSFDVEPRQTTAKATDIGVAILPTESLEHPLEKQHNHWWGKRRYLALCKKCHYRLASKVSINKTKINFPDLTVRGISLFQTLVGFALNLFYPGSQYTLRSSSGLLPPCSQSSPPTRSPQSPSIPLSKTGIFASSALRCFA